MSKKKSSFTKIFSLFLATLGLLSQFDLTLAQTVETSFPEQIFLDIKIGNQNYIGLKYLKDLGVIEGFSDGNFNSSQLVNRAEALKMLNLAINFGQYSQVEKPISSLNSTDNISTINCPFPDLDNTAWYFNNVCEAFNNGVVKGYPDGTFHPEKPINRVEALKMAILQSGLSTDIDFNDNYDDLTPNDWFWTYGKLANQKSFFVEDKNGNLYPDREMNRAEFAMLIYRVIKATSNNSEFGKATYYGGRFDGQTAASGETFNTMELTAAHKTLPFNTIVKVTNLANGKSVMVRINDRGPYVNGAIIDLSTQAFIQLASKSTGVINVEVEIVPPTP